MSDQSTIEAARLGIELQKLRAISIPLADVKSLVEAFQNLNGCVTDSINGMKREDATAIWHGAGKALSAFLQLHPTAKP